MSLKFNFLSTVGGIASVASLVGIVFGAYLFLNGQMNAIAKDMEQKAVETFKQEQMLLELKLEDQQQNIDERFLEQLQNQKILIEREIKQFPNDTLLQNKLESIKKNILKLEKSIEKRIENRLKMLSDDSGLDD